MNSNNDVEKVLLRNFMGWLETKLNEKYDPCLDRYIRCLISLKQRFLGIITILKLILEKMVELNNILFEESDSKESYDSNSTAVYKPLVDNMILILNLMLREFPECLDLEFVEYFFQSIQERVPILVAHYHQLLHFQINDSILLTKYNKIIRSLDSAFSLIPQSVREIQKRAELSVPLLKHIKDCKTMFKNPIKKLIEEMQNLSENKSFEEYEFIMEDIKNRSKNLKIKMDFINKMIDLVKEACQFQFELNKMLKAYIIMANAIKSKGKKFLNDNLKSTDQAKLLKFVTLLVRGDFINSVLPTVDVNEMIYIIKLLEAQTSLVNEYKKSLIKGIEEFEGMNPTEFEAMVEKYKTVMSEINNFQEFSQKNFEMVKFNKETITQIFKDIKRVMDKYKDFQSGIYHYQEILEFFQKIRNLTAKFCYNEFELKVELICNCNLS